MVHILCRADRPLLRIPKSFSQLQDLNGLLKKYRDIYPLRIIVCYVTTYLLSVCSFTAAVVLLLIWGIL